MSKNILLPKMHKWMMKKKRSSVVTRGMFTVLNVCSKYFRAHIEVIFIKTTIFNRQLVLDFTFFSKNNKI